MSDPRVQSVLCTAVPQGHTISLAHMTDGSYRIYLDGVMSADVIWDGTQLNDCINAYFARRWELLHPSLNHCSLA